MPNVAYPLFGPHDGSAAASGVALPISGFGTGTMITTTDGTVPVDWLRPGDRVVTFDGQDFPVRWIGRDCLRQPIETVAAAQLHPTKRQATLLAARHRMVVTGWQVELNFGQDAMLAEARHVTPDIAHFTPQQPNIAGCALIMLDSPQIIQADGYWVESLQLSDAVLGCLTDRARAAALASGADTAQHQRPCLPNMVPWEATGLGLDLAAMTAFEPGGRGMD